MMQLDFWFEFGSTYSYPAAMRLEDLAADAGVDVCWRPFLLGPIFRSQGWETSPFNLYPAKGAYMWRDMERICSDLAIPFHRPALFPQNGLLASRVALTEALEGHIPEFSRVVFLAEFSEGKQIDQPDIIGEILDRIGFAAEEVLESAKLPLVKERLKDETSEAERLQIFGAPMLIAADGEMFWGNDRIEAAIAWCSKTG